MRIGKLRGLTRQGIDDAGMLMTEAGDGSAARAIQNPAAILGNEPDAFPADRLRRRFAQASVQHAALVDAHDHEPFAATYWEVAARRASVSSRRVFAAVPPSRK